MSRVELCVNTKLGGDSVVSLSKLIKRAKELKLEGIAFSDLNDGNVFHKLKYDKDISIINGVSLNINYKGKKTRIFLLIKNKLGLSNLYKIMSLVNTKYNDSLMPVDEIFNYDDGLLVGINITDVRQYEYLKNISGDEAIANLRVFDYILVSTIDDHEYIKRMVNLLDNNHKLVCATNDIRYVLKEDKKYMDEFKENKYTDNYLMSDEELISNFSYLGDLAQKIVVDNTHKVSLMIDKDFYVLDEVIYESHTDELEKLIYQQAKELNDVDYNRIEEELTNISDANALNLLINYKLVKFSNEKEYKTYTRGNISASYLAYILGISNINPLEYKLNPPIFNDDKIVNISINYSEKIHKELIDYLYKEYHDRVVRCGTIGNYDLIFDKKGNVSKELYGIKRCYGKLIGSYFVIPDGHQINDYMPVIDLHGITSMTDYTVFLNKLIKVNIYIPSIASIYGDLSHYIKDVNLNDMNVWNSIKFIGIEEIDSYINDFVGSNILDLARQIGINRGEDVDQNSDVIFKDDLKDKKEKFLLYKAHALELALVLYKIFYVRYYNTLEFNKIIQIYQQ